MAEPRRGVKKSGRRWWRFRPGWENSSKCNGLIRMRDPDGVTHEAICDDYHEHAEYDLIEDGLAVDTRSALDHLRSTRGDLTTVTKQKARILNKEKRQAKRVTKIIEGKAPHPFPEVVALHKRISEELEKVLPATSAPKRPTDTTISSPEKFEAWRVAAATWNRRSGRLRTALYVAFAEEYLGPRDVVEVVGELEQIPIPEVPDDDIPF